MNPELFVPRNEVCGCFVVDATEKRSDEGGKNSKYTVREIVTLSRTWLEKRGVEEARLDAELLLAKALKTSRISVLIDPHRPLTNDEVDQYRALLARRGKHEPIAYILGEREFYNLNFTVNPAVLIPRHDTECLVDEVLKLLPKESSGTVVDVCTGSGCIAIAVAHRRPALQVIATDISPEAVQVAGENAKRHGVHERMRFFSGDLLKPCHNEGIKDVDIVVANPPYIRRSERDDLMPDVRDYEPELALFGLGASGLGHHLQILKQALPLLTSGGHVILEIGWDQDAAAAALPHDGYTAPRLLRDLSKNPRALVWQKI